MEFDIARRTGGENKVEKFHLVRRIKLCALPAERRASRTKVHGDNSARHSIHPLAVVPGGNEDS